MLYGLLPEINHYDNDDDDDDADDDTLVDMRWCDV